MKSKIGSNLAEKTFRELGYDPKTGKFSSPSSSYPSPASSYHLTTPKTLFRIRAIEKTAYQSPTGTTYRYSAIYRNAVVLQLLVEKFTAGLDQHMYSRYIKQLNDASRSVVANIAEGYGRPTSKDYLEFLGFSRASLEEVYTDIVHAHDQHLLSSKPSSDLLSIGIILKPSPPSSYDPLGELKRKIREIRREDITFQIFIELINKTSYLFKRTVEGLWSKLSRDEQAKLKEELANLWSRY